MIRLSRYLCSTLLLATAAVASQAADVDKATDPNPTLITLHADNQPLSDILSTISQQTGMTVRCALGQQPAPLSVNVDKQPFWNVIDDLCKRTQSSVGPAFMGNGSALTIQNGVQAQGKSTISGPVMLRFQQIQHVDDLTLAPDQQDSCEITGTAMWEPRLKVLFTEAQTAPTVAEDENGVSLLPDESALQGGPPGYPRGQNPYGQYAVPQRFNENQQFQTDLHIRLHVPSNAGRRVKDLSGKWKLFVPGKVDHLDISPIAATNQKVYSFGDLGSLKLQFAQANDEMVQLQFTTVGRGTPIQHCLFQTLHARVVDAAGALWGDTQGNRNGGQVNVGMGGDMTYLMVYVRPSAGAKGKPAKVTLEGPVTANEIDVPFSLKDFPLP